MITLTSKTTSQIIDSSLRIPSHLTQPVKHVKSWLQLLPALTYPPFISQKWLKCNPLCYTHNYTNQLTHVFQYRPFSSKRPIYHIQKTCLISLNTRFDHSSSFNSPSLFFDIFLPSEPHIFKGGGSWITPLGLYIDSVIIWLNLLPVNFQFTVMPSSWTTSPCLFIDIIMIIIDLLPTNFKITVNSYSHTPVIETISKNNSLPKITSAIIVFRL